MWRDRGRLEMGRFFRLFFSLLGETLCVACGVVLVCSRGALGDIIIITHTFYRIFFFFPFFLFLVLFSVPFLRYTSGFFVSMCLFLFFFFYLPLFELDILILFPLTHPR